MTWCRGAANSLLDRDHATTRQQCIPAAKRGRLADTRGVAADSQRNQSLTRLIRCTYASSWCWSGEYSREHDDVCVSSDEPERPGCTAPQWEQVSMADCRLSIADC